MRAQHFFLKIVIWLIALFFILLGLLLFILPWATDFRRGLIDFLTANSLELAFIGIGFLVVGLLMVLTLSSHRRRYYFIKSKNPSIYVDKNAIKQTLSNYWKKEFNSYEIDTDVELRKDKIHIIAHLPSIPFEQQKELLRKIELDITRLMNDVLGYQNDLLLTVSFAS